MPTIHLQKAQAPIINYLFNKPKTEEDWKIRNAVFVGARGLGKSYTSGIAISLALGELEALPESVPNKNIALLCGSHTQVRDIYWPLLAYQLGLEAWSVKGTSRDLGRFVFPNRTEVKCWSADAYERLRGTGQYMIVCDELPTWKTPGGSTKDAWQSVLQPCILTRWSPTQARVVGAPSPGRALFPSTPMGRDFFYDLAQMEVVDPGWKTFHYDWTYNPRVTAEDIAGIKRTVDPIKFAREYEASFEDSGLSVFYTFKRKTHVRTDLEPFDENETVHCAIDFNIMLNATSFCAVRGDQLQVLGEHKGSANTEDLAKYIRTRFPKNKIVCYPDPSGKKRVTSAPIGQTDFAILREYGFTVLAKNAAPAIVDSVAAVNRKLLNAAGEVNLVLSYDCRGLIESLERTRWVEDRPETATIDKSEGVEHFSDGLRYLVDYLWPVIHNKPRVQLGSSF